jgi:hypothetical protein
METTDKSHGDGIYKVRIGTHSEKLIQVPATSKTHYWRYVDPDGKITFIPVVNNQ